MMRKNKRIAGAVAVLGLFLFVSLGAASPMISTPEKTNEIIETNAISVQVKDRDYTHAMFAEDGTATWCQYCPMAGNALKSIYDEGLYPFYYISMVDDKNTHAATRCRTDYNIRGFPTVWFDGGYQVAVGSYPTLPQQVSWYKSMLDVCGARPVPNLNQMLTISWLGGATMQIDVSVTNNDPNPYAGRLRLYVAEKVSSMDGMCMALDSLMSSHSLIMH